MNIKRILWLLISGTLLLNSTYALADEEFNPYTAYGNYEDYKEIWGFYGVNNGNQTNGWAVFDGDKQLTDFMFNSLEYDDNGVPIVSEIREGIEYFGGIYVFCFLPDEWAERGEADYVFPMEYKKLESQHDVGTITAYIATDFNNNEEYYILKGDYELKQRNFEPEYEDMGRLLRVKSLSELAEALDFKIERVPVIGLENVYIDCREDGKYLTDKAGNVLKGPLSYIEGCLGPGDTLKVSYYYGQSSAVGGVLNRNLEDITPGSVERLLGIPNFIEKDGKIYIEINNGINDSKYYYDLEGNEVNKPEGAKPVKDGYLCSDWAAESIGKAINRNLIPDVLKGQYKNNITRGEFCRLAMQTYIMKSGKTFVVNESYFDDAKDNYISSAYCLGIVKGVGNNKFAPDNFITRQEAAVMLNNLARILNLEKTDYMPKYADEAYFADWAKESIYAVAGYESVIDSYGNKIPVMTDTGSNKFSPLVNYTREQAITTMLRLYNCDTVDKSEKGEPYIVTESDGNGAKLMDSQGNIMFEFDYINYIGGNMYIYSENMKTGLLSGDGFIIAPAEYDYNIRTYAVDGIVSLKKGDTFDIYDKNGFIESVNYHIPEYGETDKDYDLWEIAGTNIVMAEHLGDVLMMILPEQDFYIYRLVSGVKTAEEYFYIQGNVNGEFTAIDRADNKACVLNSDGSLKFKSDLESLSYLDDGLYVGVKEFENFFNPENTEQKLNIINKEGKVIARGIDSENGITVDRETRAVKAFCDGIGVEIRY